MKLLYFIFTICVAANAESLPPTQEQLENIVEIILQNIESAPEKIDQLVTETKYTVEEKLLAHKQVKKLKSTLNVTLSEEINKNGELAAKSLLECGIATIQLYNKLVTEITDDLLKKFIAEGFHKTSDYLCTLKKEVSDMQNVLENHADEEIETCLDGKSCKLIEKYLLKSEEYFTFEDNIVPALLSMVKSSGEYFNSSDTENKIVTEFTLPAFECLKTER